VPNPNNLATDLTSRTQRAEASEADTRAEPAERSDAPRPPWQFEVGQLIQQAVAVCIEHGVEVEAFMNGCWSAYLEGRPGMRAQIEEAQLKSQLEELRKLGKLGQA
jgi:hypothetical protein